MPTLIKSSGIVADTYTRIDAATAVQNGVLTLPAGDILVDLDTLLAHHQVILAMPAARACS